MAGRPISKEDFEKQYDRFLQESVSSDCSSINTERLKELVSSGLDETASNSTHSATWWLKGELTSDELIATGRSFLRTKPADKPVPSPRAKKSAESLLLSSDSLSANEGGGGEDVAQDNGIGDHDEEQNESSSSSKEVSVRIGLDTLIENIEKEQFFQNIEEPEGGINFAQLNEDLGRTAVSDEISSKEKSSDDRQSLLSKVSLMDSFESSNEKKESLDEIHSEMHIIPEEPSLSSHSVSSNGDEVDGLPASTTAHDMEAIRNEYQRIGEMNESETQDCSSLAASSHIHEQSHPDSSYTTNQSSGFGMKHIGAGDSNVQSSTAEEAFRPQVSPRKILQNFRRKKASLKLSKHLPNAKNGRAHSKYENVKSSGYGRATANGRPRPVSDSHSFREISSKVTWSPDVNSGSRIPVRSREIYNSIESFAQYIEQTVSSDVTDSQKLLDTEAFLREIEHWKKVYEQERLKRSKMEANWAVEEKVTAEKLKDLHMKYEKKILGLEQQVYILSAERAAKISESQQAAPPELEESGKVKALEKEMETQEDLIQQYQKENQKLTDMVKASKTWSDATQKQMFMENKKLIQEIAILRDERESAQAQVNFLQAQTSLEQRDAYSEILPQLRLENEQLQMQNAALHRQLISSADHPGQGLSANAPSREQPSLLEEKLLFLSKLTSQQEADLQENGRKFDELKEENGKLETEVNRRKSEMNIRHRERSRDAKRIKDLEKQLQEMRTVVEKRHPNSLPVLMWAAAEGDKRRGRTIEELESQIRRMEGQLENRDNEAKLCITSLQQQFNSIKLQYEEKIAHLESLISEQNLEKNCLGISSTHEILPRDQERETVNDIQTLEIVRLKEELQNLRVAGRSARPFVNPVEKKAVALRRDVIALEKEKIALKAVIERLQKQKQGLTFEIKCSHHFAGKSGKPKEKPTLCSKSETDSAKSALETDLRTTANSGNMKELERLASENENLRQQIEEQRGRDVEKMDRLQLEHSSLREAHQLQLQQMMADHARSFSVSRVSLLQSKLATEQALTKHLRGQLDKAELNSEGLHQAMKKQEALEKRVQQLLNELAESRQHWTPDQKQFIRIKDKLSEMEAHIAQRQDTIERSVLCNPAAASSSELADQMIYWQRVAESRSNQVRAFREELDYILALLEELRRQGITIPSISLRR